MNAYFIQRAHSFMEKANKSEEKSKDEKKLEELEDRNTLITKNHKQGFYSNNDTIDKLNDLEKDVDKMD